MLKACMQRHHPHARRISHVLHSRSNKRHQTRQQNVLTEQSQGSGTQRSDVRKTQCTQWWPPRAGCHDASPCDEGEWSNRIRMTVRVDRSMMMMMMMMMMEAEGLLQQNHHRLHRGRRRLRSSTFGTLGRRFDELIDRASACPDRGRLRGGGFQRPNGAERGLLARSSPMRLASPHR